MDRKVALVGARFGVCTLRHMVRVIQLSDSHFTTEDRQTYGGLGYDTTAAWQSIFEHAFAETSLPGSHAGPPDLVIVTGDIADRGRADEYAIAATQLAIIPARTNLLIGNHDWSVAFGALTTASGMEAEPTLRIGNWLFVFADSNHDGKEICADGVLHDRPDRIRALGELGSAELDRLDADIGASDAAHVFLWVHHPPLAPGHYNAPTYDGELAGLLRRHPRLRGIGGGHMHTDTVDELEGRPVFTCPSFTLNIDLVTGLTQPPGYRTYEFSDNGDVASSCHFMDDERWPRRELPEAIVSWWGGGATLAEMLQALRELRHTIDMDTDH